MSTPNRFNIPYLHWQPRIGRNGADALGEIVNGIDDIEQCITTIVLTEKGTVPLEPEKCCRIQPYIDRRADYAIPYITREIFDALTIWEPRIVVEQVLITPVDFAHWRFPVYWRLRADVARQVRQTNVILPENRRPQEATYAA